MLPPEIRRRLSDELFIEDTTSTGELAQRLKLSGCDKCTLYRERGGRVAPVPGEGRGRIMLVGHRIGNDEANLSQPAVGLASRPAFTMLLEALFPDVRVPEARARETALGFTYVTNHTRCGTAPDLKITTKHATVCSRAWLQYELFVVDPVIIVFWHRESAKAVLGMSPPGAGQIFEGTLYGRRYPMMVMTHPAAIARDNAMQTPVMAHYRALAAWLYEKGYLKELPRGVNLSRGEARHHLVTTRAALGQVIDRLLEEPFIGYDTETRMRADYARQSDYEKKEGALLWTRDGFSLVTAQLAAPEADGVVRDTYTIACGFVDMTGRPRQEITEDDLARALDRLFRHRVAGGTRYVAMWNADFDCPVTTRLGVDLLGMSHQDYPIEIVDGMLMLVRMNEHLSRIKGLSLGAASQYFIQETKPKFDEKFSPQRFPYTDLDDEETRRTLLEYTGDDPRLALLTTQAVAAELARHVREIAPRAQKSRSSVPTLAARPFPTINPALPAGTAPARLRDVAIPIEHQMLPVLAQMHMVGFRFEREAFKQLEVYVGRRRMELLYELRALGEGGLNPNSDQQVRALVERTLAELIDKANALIAIARAGSEAETVTKKVADALGLPKPKAAELADFRATREAVISAYEATFGELTTEQQAIEKLITYLERAAVFAELTAGDLADESERERASQLAPFADTDYLERVFEIVWAYKGLDKKWGTYFERFSAIADRDGIINPEYKLHDTVSGRLSGNFQNVPRGDEEDEDARALDVRQYLKVVRAEDLNRLFNRMKGLRAPGGRPWRVREEPYVGVMADYAAQEDRMAFAQTGDRTKARLLSTRCPVTGGELDTHFYNAAFIFGPSVTDPETGRPFDVATDEGVMKCYVYLVRNKAKYKDTLRTPVKTVHYARQYGAADQKIHNLLMPVFARQGRAWTLEETKELTAKYDELYAGVTEARRAVMAMLDEHPFIEYPVFGTIRHAKNIRGRVHKGEYLSVANAWNQGTCAYITKLAMIRMRRLIQMNAHRWNLVEVGGDAFVGLVLQVHDEIGVICPARLAVEVKAVLESAMKIWVRPGLPGEPASWHEKDGHLVLPDPAFKAEVLFDAEAEVKRTIAKLGKKKILGEDGTERVIYERLPSGETNLVPEEELTPSGINARYALRLSHAAAGLLPDLSEPTPLAGSACA